MTYEEFRDRAFAYAMEQGCTAAETTYGEGEQFTAQILEQEVDSYSSSRFCGVSLRVQKGGKNGYARTEVLEDPETLVRHAMDNAAVVECPDEIPMQGPQEYPAITLPDNPIMRMDEREKIELALRMERKIKELDPRVQRVESDIVCTVSETVKLDNTRGLHAEKTEQVSYSYIAPILKEGEEVRDGGAFRTGAEMLDPDGCAAEAVREAAQMFGARPVPAGEYPVVMRYDAAADLLDAFSPLFSADMAQKGLSLLAGREGETIAAPCVTIIDDPLYPRSPRAFDAEGTPSVTKTVVENGRLRTLLHNLKTAKKAGCASTSNAANTRGDVCPSNFYIAAGERDFDALVQTMGDGLVITEISGLHAGVNTVSGDFSLLAKGLRIENGQVVHPVEQITVAGSFLPLLCDIVEVGSDLKFGIPGDGSVGSPSLRIRKLAVAGK